MIPPAPKAPPAESKSNKDKLREYGSAVAATAPLAALYTASDIPIKTSEGVAALKLREKFPAPELPKAAPHKATPPPPAKSLWSKLRKKAPPVPKAPPAKAVPQGTKALYKAGLRRSLGNAAGSMAIGALTMPIHALAVKKMSSDDPGERKRGVALLMGQGLAFTAVRGAGEAAGEAAKGAKLPAVLTKYRGKLAAGALVGLPVLYLKRKGVADQRRRDAKREKPESTKDWVHKLEGVIRPALTSGAVGAGVGAVESVTEHLSKVPKGQRGAVAKQLVSRSGLRLVAPKALAYGGAGLAGGVVSKLILDSAIDKMKDKLKG